MNERLRKILLSRLAGPIAWPVLIIVLAVGLHPASGRQARNLLWQIGTQDKDDREFVLAPGGYGKFHEDGFFVVGQSDPKRDWPYVHPGPEDSWAGSRRHTFTIVFGLRTAPAGGDCRLLFSLVDTHRNAPPVLDIEVNSNSFQRKLPAPAGRFR